MSEKKQEFLIGTYTESVLFGDGSHFIGNGEGIYLAEIDMVSGKMRLKQTIEGIKNPSYVCADKAGKRIYAVSELEEYEGLESGAVSVYETGEDGSVMLLDRKPSMGTDPCHLYLDEVEEILYISNYGSGSVCAYRIGKDGCFLEPAMVIRHHGRSIDETRQEGPHVHSVHPCRFAEGVLVCDLGLDKISRCAVREKDGRWTFTEEESWMTEPGYGPRMLVYHPVLPMFYVVQEMGNRVLVYDCQNGVPQAVQDVSTLTEEDGEISNTAAEIRIDHSGNKLYVSNRGADNISVYDLDREGRLVFADSISSGGKTPRCFAAAEDRESKSTYLVIANQDSNELISVKYTGAGTAEIKDRMHLGSPVCVWALSVLEGRER